MMQRNTLPLLLLALACAGCRADADAGARPAAAGSAARPAIVHASDTTGAAQADSAVAEAAPPPPPADPPGTAYLAWSADSARAETAWLRDDGTVAATRPQLVIAAGGGLWAWTRRMQLVDGTDCACIERRMARDPSLDEADPPRGLCPTVGRAPALAAVDLLSGRKAPLLGPPTGVSGGEPLLQDLTPIASVGPYLFAEGWLWSYSCGANHGNSSHEFPVFDLANGARRVEVVRGDTFRLLAPQVRRARQLLSEPGRAATPLQQFSLTAVEPRWRATGMLEVGYRFAADACWACGDEHASGYFASERVPGPVPLLLAAWASAPAAVRRYWSAHPPLEHAGWSRIPAADAPRALRRFRAR
jgi:hypothetical protein